MPMQLSYARFPGMEYLPEDQGTPLRTPPPPAGAMLRADQQGSGDFNSAQLAAYNIHNQQDQLRQQALINQIQFGLEQKKFEQAQRQANWERGLQQQQLDQKAKEFSMQMQGQTADRQLRERQLANEVANQGSDRELRLRLALMDAASKDKDLAFRGKEMLARMGIDQSKLDLERADLGLRKSDMESKLGLAGIELGLKAEGMDRDSDLQDRNLALKHLDTILNEKRARADRDLSKTKIILDTLQDDKKNNLQKYGIDAGIMSDLVKADMAQQNADTDNQYRYDALAEQRAYHAGALQQQNDAMKARTAVAASRMQAANQRQAALAATQGARGVSNDLKTHANDYIVDYMTGAATDPNNPKQVKAWSDVFGEDVSPASLDLGQVKDTAGMARLRSQLNQVSNEIGRNPELLSVPAATWVKIAAQREGLDPDQTDHVDVPSTFFGKDTTDTMKIVYPKGNLRAEWAYLTLDGILKARADFLKESGTSATLQDQAQRAAYDKYLKELTIKPLGILLHAQDPQFADKNTGRQSPAMQVPIPPEFSDLDQFGAWADNYTGIPFENQDQFGDLTNMVPAM